MNWWYDRRDHNQEHALKYVHEKDMNEYEIQYSWAMLRCCRGGLPLINLSNAPFGCLA